MKNIVIDGQTTGPASTGQVDVGSTAAQLSTSSRDLKWGVEVFADADNSNAIWVGYSSNITAGGGETSGVKIPAGKSQFIPAASLSRVYVISDASSQSVTYLGM